ncbi:MAG: hypothetical protein RLZZ488_657 [Pseudomonadota bacterium]
MAANLLSKNRIRGVSFRRGRSSPVSNSLSVDSTWSGPSAEQIRQSAPRPLRKTDLSRLLRDYGRNELHTLVSETVEQLGRLRQIVGTMRRLPTESEPDRHFLNPDDSDDSDAHPLQNVALEMMRVQRLWKLRLEVLEMIAMAQDSLRNYGTEPSGKPRQLGAKSAPLRK